MQQVVVMEAPTDSVDCDGDGDGDERSMMVAIVLMIVMNISVRPFRERANSRETTAEAPGLDAPPECGVRHVMMKW